MICFHIWNFICDLFSHIDFICDLFSHINFIYELRISYVICFYI